MGGSIGGGAHGNGEARARQPSRGWGGGKRGKRGAPPPRAVRPLPPRTPRRLAPDASLGPAPRIPLARHAGLRPPHASTRPPRPHRASTPPKAQTHSAGAAAAKAAHPTLQPAPCAAHGPPPRGGAAASTSAVPGPRGRPPPRVHALGCSAPMPVTLSAIAWIGSISGFLPCGGAGGLRDCTLPALPTFGSGPGAGPRSRRFGARPMAALSVESTCLRAWRAGRRQGEARDERRARRGVRWYVSSGLPARARPPAHAAGRGARAAQRRGSRRGSASAPC